jgi:hypothetical protein
LYTDLFVDQFFIDVIGQCPSNTKAIEYEPNGQWKPVGEEKQSRRAQREREAFKAAQTGKSTNGKSTVEMDHSADDDSDDDRSRTSNSSIENNKQKYIDHVIESVERSTVTNAHDDIPVIELDDD